MSEQITRKTLLSTLKYLRQEKLPHVWCPGCGNGVVIKALVHAIDALHLEQNDVAVIGGIGCSGRTAFILDFNTMHTTHGRALAFATGLKLVKPNMHVIVAMGDGDSVGIGGNHFIHACRRNIDMTAIIFNNAIYGQTGGQLAPTTPQDARSATSLYGNIEPNFDIAKLALAAGSSFVARTTTFEPREMESFIEQAIDHHGFSVVEIITTCPTYFGRMNQMREPYDMIRNIRATTLSTDELHETAEEMERAIRKRVIKAGDAERLPQEELQGKMITGIFRQAHRVEYIEKYRELSKKSQQQER